MLPSLLFISLCCAGKELFYEFPPSCAPYSYEGLTTAQSVINLHQNSVEGDTLSYPGCSQATTDSCVKADVNMYMLMTGSTVELPGGRQLLLSHREEHHACFKVGTYTYQGMIMCSMVQSGDAEAIFSWQGRHVAGKVHVGAESWTLEGCGEQCFLWIKQSNSLKYQMSSAILSRSTRNMHPPFNYAKLRVTY